MRENRKPTQHVVLHMVIRSLKKVSKILNRKENLFNKWYWENWIPTCKRRKLGPYFTLYAKINSKQTQ